MFFTHFTADMFTRLAISTYQPSSLYRSRYTLLHLPYSGSLEHHFPTFTICFQTNYYKPSVLRSTKTTERSSRARSLVAPHTIPCLLCYSCLHHFGELDAQLSTMQRLEKFGFGLSIFLPLSLQGSFQSSRVPGLPL